MMLTCEGRFVGISRKVQQPRVGTSTMLGPPGTVTTGVDLPDGRPSTVNCTGSRSSHKILLALPSTRGLGPATSLPAKTNATASPEAAAVHGTGQGVPFVCDQPPW